MPGSVRLAVGFVLCASACRAVSAEPPEAPDAVTSSPREPSAQSPTAPTAPTPALPGSSGPVATPTTPVTTTGEPRRPVIPDLFDDSNRARPSGAIEAEERHFAEMHTELPRLQRLPDYLSVNDVLALVPRDDRERLREEIHAQLESGSGSVLRGAPLDSEGRWFLLWIADHLEQTSAVYDHRGRRTDRRSFSRATPYLRDVLTLETRPEQERGQQTQELVVVRVTTMSVCCLPSDLELYRLDRGGKLQRALVFPRSHVEVGPGIRYHYLNHFEFSDDGHLVVSRVYPESDTRWELVYRAATGRYEPTPETARRLRAEKTHSPHEESAP